MSAQADAQATPATTAAALRRLHRAGSPLVLPNIWDALSAQAVQAAGFPAVATSSAALATSLGYPDGEAAPVDLVMQALARIVASVSVPVTADIERGYRLGADELVRRLADSGVTGCNVEDSDPGTGMLIDPRMQADLLYAVRTAALGTGVDLVINARVDTVLRGVEPGAQVADIVERARHYVEAGADCIYPILLGDPDDVAVVVMNVDAPVNILVRPGVPGTASAGELARLGVARISYGPGLLRMLQDRLQATLLAIRDGRDPLRDEPAPQLDVLGDGGS